MNGIPHIKIQLEGIKQGIAHCFTKNNDELNKMVIHKIEKTLTEDWVISEIDRNVRILLNEAIGNITKDWTLKNAITTMISNSISSQIEKMQESETTEVEK